MDSLPRPYYDEAGITIYHGDCRGILPLLRGDAVITDPPYGIGKAEWDSEFPTWWFDVAAQVAPALAVMPGPWNILHCPHEAGRLRYRWMLSARLVNGMTNGAIGFGNWIPCLLYSADGISLYRQDGDAKEFVVGREDKPDHPSPKPLGPVRWFIDRLPGMVVVDPFMGSGTSLLAAKDLGRRAIGIEIEERYCEIAAKRLSQEVLIGG